MMTELYCAYYAKSIGCIHNEKWKILQSIGNLAQKYSKIRGIYKYTKITYGFTMYKYAYIALNGGINYHNLISGSAQLCPEYGQKGIVNKS